MRSCEVYDVPHQRRAAAVRNIRHSIALQKIGGCTADFRVFSTQYSALSLTGWHRKYHKGLRPTHRNENQPRRHGDHRETSVESKTPCRGPPLAKPKGDE